ncbi:hypothetical protein CHH28_02690 [Bacterioplanes sanyensis]|uniref:Fibronectin type-III domain-containing protein n=2 Tax=Bacterioplanes sanyensis TaxID=1249553 RepID=A0A222FGN5_9GAMM|nr:hypothetical protein CHH28_02690 [Bacterioplanes sanyensis]
MALVGCQSSEQDKDKVEGVPADQDLRADQITITEPFNRSVVYDSIVNVRANIPEAADVQEVALFVDGIEVARDTDGEPWQIPWASYYWADNDSHTLMLKAVTKGGNEVRSNQLFYVYVDTSTTEMLGFEPGIANAVLKDQNSLTVAFNELPSATKYEVKYINEDIEKKIETQVTEVELTDLAVGEYELSYRAFNQERVGPWSESVTFEVAATDLPALNAAEISPSESGYDVRLSWQDMSEDSTYNVELTSLINEEDSSVHEDISGNELLLSDLPTGRYEWRLTRINSLNQASQPSQPELLELGVFSRILGGSGEDTAKQLISSNRGGYIVLGTTLSQEVSASVDTEGDNWIVKLDDQGKVEWQYIDNAAGRSRFEDIVELADGSIVAVGSDASANSGVALKLSNQGSSLWEVTYRPENVAERYDFLDVVEFNGSLYASAAKWGQAGCNGCTKRTEYYVHAIGSGDGTVSDPIELPEVTGVKRVSIDKLVQTAAGELLLAGMAMPEVDGTGSIIQTGAYLQILNSALIEVAAWNNAGKLFHGNLGDVVELTNGRFAIIGQGINESNAHVAVVYSNEGKLVAHSDDASGYSYTNQPLSAGLDGDFYSAFSGASSRGDSIKLAKFGAEATFKSATSDGYAFSQPPFISGLTSNDDGTFTYLVNQPQSGNKTDIMVVKAVFQ